MDVPFAHLPERNHSPFEDTRTAAWPEIRTLDSGRTEGEFRERFPDCETGAMPPFGNLYDMPVFADESLARDKEIAFNAGSHCELVRLAWDDFVRLVEPKIVRFGGGSIHSTAA